MATGGESDTEIETSIDVAGFMRAFDAEDDDNTGNVSMFCKACLHPYRGEQKSGTIVLRCERCGQTDTILEQEVGSLDPQEWIGNLMMNRFMQVVKEQSDMGTSLIDPNFADDEYQHVCMATSEYTYRIDKLANSFFDFATHNGLLSEDDIARVEPMLNAPEEGRFIEIKPIRTTRALMELHDIMNTRMSELRKRKDGTNKSEDEKTSTNDAGKHASETESHASGTKTNTLCKGVTGGDPDDMLARINGQLDQLGPSILNLIEGLISKHRLSANTMHNIQQRILLKELGRSTGAQAPVTTATPANQEEEPVVAERAGDSNTEAADQDEDTNNSNENNSEPPSDAEADGEEDNTEESSIMTPEVLDVLNKKFRLKFGTEDRESNSANLYNKFAEEDQAKAASNGDGVTANQSDASVPMENYNPAEHIRMNIYTLSNEFVRELNTTKQSSFGDRKDTALRELHERCVRVKREMKLVEEAVVEELELAYDRKTKKVANQVKQIDEKQEQLEEAQRLLEFYARTGQQEKLAELMRNINLHSEKN